MDPMKTLDELVDATDATMANAREDYSQDPLAGVAYDASVDLSGRLVMKLGGDGMESWVLGLQRMAGVIQEADKVLRAKDQASLDAALQDLRHAMERLGAA